MRLQQMLPFSIAVKLHHINALDTFQNYCVLRNNQRPAAFCSIAEKTRFRKEEKEKTHILPHFGRQLSEMHVQSVPM